MSRPNEIKVTLSPEVPEQFPGFSVEFMLAPTGRYETPAEGEEQIQRLVRAVTDRHASSASLESHPLEDAYREFYRGMGLKAAQVSNPVKQTRRALERGYRSISRPVDIAMEIEYVTLVSFQLYDAGQLPPEIYYRLATGTEPIITSREEQKTCKRGELILTSRHDVVHSSYYGTAKTMMLTGKAEVALIRILQVPGMPDEIFDEACEQARSRIAWLAAARASADRPSCVLRPATLEVAGSQSAR
jgi:DNA/RNA-binding domain of Phe-tRNA-synthetase-like protein